MKYCRELRHKATKPEKKVKEMLNSLGIKFKFQWVFFGKEGFVIVDFYLPDYRVVLEIDGKDHLKEEAVIYDYNRTLFLKNRCAINEVIRFQNKVVMWSPDKVREELFALFCDRQKDIFSSRFFATIG